MAIAFGLAVIFVIQLSSVILTGDVADYRFYENFNIKDVLSVADFFGKEGIILALVLVLTTFMIHFLSKQIRKAIIKILIPIGILLVGVVLMAFNGGIINNAYHTIILKSAGDASIDEALTSLQISKDDYVYKNEITATKGKNIIVLSLESLEKGYLGEKLKHLTPNLNKLAKENTLLRMEQSPAGAWTSASMYIALTGIPAYFSIHGNSVFQSSHENKLTTLPDVLKNAGYELQYFIGKKEYSGIDDMLKTHGFTVKSEKDFETKYQEVAWGIQDMDLFKELKKALLNENIFGKPYAFFLSTIGTHFPNGVPDARVDSLLPAQKSRLELMASATDYYVGDLIDFLEKEKMLENTVFFIYPDHLLMGKTSRVVEDFDERSLYLLTNANPNKLGIDLNKNINQIDVPKLILKGAEIENNAKFLTDFIKEDNKNTFLRKNAKSLLQLNTAALKSLNLKEGFTISQNIEDNNFIIKDIDENVLLQKETPPIGKCYRILLDENLRPYNNFLINYSEVGNTTPKDRHLDLFKSGDDLIVTINGRKSFGITKKSTNEISFTTEDLNLFEEANFADKSSLIISSNSWKSKVGSGFVIKGKNQSISRGLTIIALNSKSKIDYRTFDTYNSIIDVDNFIKTLKKLEDDKTPYVILAHDSAAKSLKSISNKLNEMGFIKLSKLQDREAYVMYNLDGKKVETVDEKSINIQLNFPKEIKNTKLYFSGPRIAFKPNINRYIAHAGGEIEGLKYTNSINALDFNYNQGFRLFELDISKTSDGVYVATHDWNHWKKETGYSGEIPVSLSEFKKYKIRGKYSTLDMASINNWFSNHNDATLITDKINEPKEFANKFVDKNRLIMELFDLKAADEAQKNGTSALLSEKAISNIKGDVVSYLLGHKIKYVGLSRRSIASKKDFIQKCLKNNIKVYVYHVNFDQGKDEKYVYQNEVGLVYGMYADKWLNEFKP